MHIAWEYPPLVYGGLGRHVHAIATAQAALGNDVTVITQHSEKAPTVAIEEGVRVIRDAQTPHLDFGIDNLLKWVETLDGALASSATTVASETPVDIVHCHDWMTTKAGISASENAPLVATIHATEQGRHQGYLPGELSLTIDSIERYLSNAADAVVVCSHAMRDEIMRQFSVAESRISVIPNGIDMQVWNTTPERVAKARKKWAGNRPLIVFTGRIEVEKGIFTLIHAIRDIARTYPNIKLVMAGTGSQSNNLSTALHDLDIAHLIQQTGWLPEDELKALIAAADVAVVPSLYEPFGLVALEAMSLQTPVVASRVGGLADIVRDNHTGFSYSAGDAQELASAISTVLELDPEQRHTLVDRSYRAAQEYTWQSSAEQTLDLYAQITADAHSSINS